MECLKQYPWLAAGAFAVLLSLIFGFVMQLAVLTKEQRNPLGYFLGMFESLIFMAAFAGAGTMGAAWLGFKVASKWKSWSIFAEHDEGAKAHTNVQEVSRQYRSFLVGSAGNVVIGLVAAGVAYALGASPLRL
jgi:hypothetical protein